MKHNKMQENHLKPNEEGYSNNQQDLLNASLIFARALGIILQEKQGIVVDVQGDINLGETKKVIVFLRDEKIHISECPEDLPEGTAIELDDTAGEVTP